MLKSLLFGVVGKQYRYSANFDSWLPFSLCCEKTNDVIHNWRQLTNNYYAHPRACASTPRPLSSKTNSPLSALRLLGLFLAVVPQLGQGWNQLTMRLDRLHAWLYIASYGGGRKSCRSLVLLVVCAHRGFDEVVRRGQDDLKRDIVTIQDQRTKLTNSDNSTTFFT